MSRRSERPVVNNNLELTHYDCRHQDKIDPHGVVTASFWLDGFDLPSDFGHQETFEY